MFIGLVGRARHGKTTVATQMEEIAKFYQLKAKQYDIGAEVLSFCISSGRLPNKKREDLGKAELYVLAQVGLQMREKDENFWLRRILEKVESDQVDVALLPNVRYYNEAGMVRTNGGRLVRVTALTEHGTEWISDDRDPNHVSEAGIAHIPADFYIIARKGQDQLVRAMATNVFEEIVREMRE